jgi:hypothetical protein
VTGERETTVSSEREASVLRFVGVAAASAVSAGLLVITATVLVVDLLRDGGRNPDLDLPFYILVGGTLIGLLLAAYVAWLLLAPVGSTYRRGGLSIVCAFATTLLMLICIPVNQVFGRTGLLLVLGLSAVAATVLTRQAWRLRGRT